jgi:hypothetical protein
MLSFVLAGFSSLPAGEEIEERFAAGERKARNARPICRTAPARVEE